jgi:uncharacterized lipoprotein YddW (UPF0748 family)
MLFWKSTPDVFMRDRAPRIGLRPGLIAAAAVLVLFATAARLNLHAQATTAAEVRAIWVVRSTLSSATAIETMVDAAKAAGFNTLLVQVRSQHDAHDLAIEGFDPIAETVERAHAAGLQVHGWISVSLASNAADLPLSREHVVYRHPDWLMVPQALAADLIKVDPKSPEYLGRLARYVRAQPAGVDELYMSPVVPAAADYVVDSIREIVAKYPFDGVHLDSLRYPRSDFDFGRESLAGFRRSVVATLSAADQAAYDRRLTTEPLIYTEAFPERWRAFRADHVTGLVARLDEAIKAVRPSALLSVAVAPDPVAAAANTLQDWRTWLDRDLIDVVCPVTSTTDIALFASQVASARQAAGPHPLWAGIGASRLSQTEVVAKIQAARRIGAGGVALFSYDGLTGPSRGTEYLAQLGRAAFLQ